MSAPSCDRCGELVPRDAPTRRTLHLTTYFTRRHLRQRLDLCGSCRQSFGDWLQQPVASTIYVAEAN